MKTYWLKTYWRLILGFFVGLMLFPISQLMGPSLGSGYDFLFPVVVMDGDILQRQPDFVDVHIWGEKRRNCKYMNLQAYTREKNLMHDAKISRIDGPNVGNTKPLGTFDIGVWRVTPIENRTSVVVFVRHDCSGRVVLTKIADEQI